MREADFYPSGAYNDPSAPYNEPMVPERDFDVCISQTLSKSVKVTTDDYLPEFDEEDGHTYANTDWTVWKDVYAENDYHTPMQLIALFRRYLQDELEHSGIAVRTPEHLRHLMEECDGWIEDECEIIED